MGVNMGFHCQQASKEACSICCPQTGGMGGRCFLADSLRLNTSRREKWVNLGFHCQQTSTEACSICRPQTGGMGGRCYFADSQRLNTSRREKWV